MSPGRLDKVRASLKPRPRQPRPVAQSAPTALPPAAIAPPAPPVAQELVSRRDRLEREYAEIQSDLGGLVYEMAIRDSYRLDVITRQAAKLQAVDAQLTEVERSIAALSQPQAPPVIPPPASPPAPAPAPTAQAAAAPAPAPTTAMPAAATACPSCGQPVEPGAAFCGSCGAPQGSSPPPPAS